MNRPLVILLGVLALGAAIFTGSFYFSQRACANMMGGKDDLSWLQSEFHLGDTEMARVRKLHEGYLPQCMKMCAKIAAKKDEVAAALAGGTNVTAEVQKKLGELGGLHAQCQAQMLQHFVDVSRAMPPEEGRRYLAEMERITIGFDGVEQAMSLQTMETTEADARDRADMERLMAGNAAALNDLMERHATPVFHFLCRMAGNEDDANDLAQETFVRVFKSRDSFRTEQRFSSWLFTIAANLARNHFRWRSRHPALSLDAEDNETKQSIGSTLPANSPAPSEESLAKERAGAVRTAVKNLPEDLREAIVLCEWEECSVAEAATILETTPKAVESRLYRARQILRERLKSWL